jgi:hypothetical protein
LPRVPTLDNQVRNQAAPDFQQRPLQRTFGQDIGQGVANVGHVVNKIQQEEQDKADRAAFMEADRNTDTISNDLLAQAQSKKFKDAIGITPELMSNFDREAGKIEGSLKSDRQKTAYRQSINNRRSQLQRSFDSHEGQQREAYYAKSREDYKDQAHVNAVTNYQDPARVEQEVDKVRATVDQTPGIDEKQRASELGKRRSDIYAGVIDRYLSNDQVNQADAYYKTVKERVDGPVAANIERGIAVAKNRLESEKKAKLTELRQSLNDQLQDIAASAQLGIAVTNVPSKDVLKAVFGEYEGTQRHETAQKMANLSVEVNGMHGLSTTDLIGAADSYVPKTQAGAADAAQTAGFVGGRVRQILTEREKDPAGYMTQHSPSVKQAWEAFSQAGDDESRAAYLKTVRAERERLQIPGDDVIPNGYAEQVADQINTADAQKMATVIANEAQKWGADWPAVQGQLAPKISDIAAVISSGIPRGPAVQLAATAKLKENELAALLPPGTKWPDIKDKVATELEQFSASLPIEATSTVGAFQDAAERLTAQYMHQGMSLGNAAKKARTDLVRDQIVEFRSAPFRVPPEEDPGLIENGARRAIETFEPAPNSVIPNGANSTESYLADLTTYVRDNGYWVTRPDAKGLRLYADGGPVIGVDGPVQYTWEQLRAGGDAEAERARKIRADEVRRRQELR